MNIQPKFKPTQISGFPEQLPEAQTVYDRVSKTIQRHYSRAGAMHIETPVVERIKTLTAKGGGAISKEIYGLRRLSESGDGSASELALRFDLTVPLARYVAQHQSELVFPFRRYQIGRVYRGERPQSGRFREFEQADFDIIGRESLPAIADAEPIAIINDIFSELEVGPFVVRINNRKILNGYFTHLGIDPVLQGAVLAIIDKVDRGRDAAVEKLCKVLSTDRETAESILEFTVQPVPSAEVENYLAQYRLNDELCEGIEELVAVVKATTAFGVPAERLKIDLSVARGLDYYTGSVFETVLLDHLSLGSVCSGGRYDDLAGNFTTGNFPGVGISIGVSRLVSRLVEQAILTPKHAFDRHVLVTNVEPSLQSIYLSLTAKLRRAGIPTEAFLDDAGLGTQLRYAGRKGYGFAVILGSTEHEAGVASLKDLNTGTQRTVKIDDLVGELQ